MMTTKERALLRAVAEAVVDNKTNADLTKALLECVRLTFNAVEDEQTERKAREVKLNADGYTVPAGYTGLSAGYVEVSTAPFANRFSSEHAPVTYKYNPVGMAGESAGRRYPDPVEAHKATVAAPPVPARFDWVRNVTGYVTVYDRVSGKAVCRLTEEFSRIDFWAEVISNALNEKDNAL